MDGKRAGDIMTHPVVSVAPSALIVDAIALLLRHHISGLPVATADGTLVGIITEHDVLNFALSGNAAETRVDEAMTDEVITIAPDMGVVPVMELLTTRHLRRVPVVQDGKVVGIVSRRDVLREMLFMYSQFH